MSRDKNKKGVRKKIHIAVMGTKGLPSKGGGERVAEAIIKKALDNGYKVTVYGKKNYCGHYNNYKNLKLILIREFSGKHLSAFSFGLLSAFHALLFCKYDLVHLHYADFGFLVPLLRLRFKVICTSHGAEYNRDKWSKFAKWCFMLFEFPFVKFSSICTSVSKPLAGYYKKKYKRDVLYIPNGIYVDESQCTDDGVYQKYNLSSREYILFCAGRIIPSKGCDIFLKACTKMELKNQIVIVGKIEDTHYKHHLAKLAGSNTLFIDFVESKVELFKLIFNCRFFVFPSAYEAMSIILLEVASLKKGIICSDIEENVEAIADNALYFKSGNLDDLAEKINYALENEGEINSLGLMAFDWVVRERDWNKISERYMDLYNSF